MNPLRCTLLLAAIFLFLSPLAQAESPQITWSRAPGEQYDTLTLDGKAIPEDVDGDSEKFLAAAGHDHNLNIEILIPDGAWNPDAPSVTWPRLQGGAVKFFQSLTARWALSYRYGRTPLSRHFMVCKLDGAELTYETGKDQFVSWSKAKPFFTRMKGPGILDIDIISSQPAFGVMDLNSSLTEMLAKVHVLVCPHTVSGSPY